MPQPLFVSNIAAGTHGFDVGKDGRFLIPARGTRSASAPITVVVNRTGLLQD